MIKFFKNLKVNGTNWSECSLLVKASAILAISAYLIIIATLIKIAVFSSDSSVSILATVLIILLCNSVKITYEK